MIFLIDVDEVLADFSGGVQKLVDAPLNTTEWDFFGGMDPDVRESAMRLIDAPGFCRDLDVLPGAQEGVERLRSLGCEIVAVTSPWKTSPTWCHERAAWLEKHFGIKDVIHTDRKFLVQGNFFLDDRPTHVVRWAAANLGGRAMLWSSKFNANERLLCGVSSWLKVYEIVRSA